MIKVETWSLPSPEGARVHGRVCLHSQRRMDSVMVEKICSAKGPREFL